MQSAYSVPGRRRRRGRRRCRDAPVGAPPEGNAKEVIRRRRRVTMAASSDGSVVAHSSLPAASRVSPSSVVCSTTPLAQTFPQVAQHVVERGALTHLHDSERSSHCSQRGSLRARALLASLCLAFASLCSPFRSAFSLCSQRFALLFRSAPPFSHSEIRSACPRFRSPPEQSDDTRRSPPEQSDDSHRSAQAHSEIFFRCAVVLGWCVLLGWYLRPSYVGGSMKSKLVGTINLKRSVPPQNLASHNLTTSTLSHRS